MSAEQPRFRGLPAATGWVVLGALSAWLLWLVAALVIGFFASVVVSTRLGPGAAKRNWLLYRTGLLSVLGIACLAAVLSSPRVFLAMLGLG